MACVLQVSIAVIPSATEAKMHIESACSSVAKFSNIQFRRKRLTVVVHAHFDMEKTEDVTHIRELIEQAVSALIAEGQAKITYSLSDI